MRTGLRGLLILSVLVVLACATASLAQVPEPTASSTAQPVPSATASPPGMASPMAGGSALTLGLAVLPAAIVGLVTFVGLMLLPALLTVFR